MSEFPPSTPISNLSVPGLTLADALTRRPAPPLSHRNDAQQTAINFILGMPGLLDGDAPRPTQLEYALQGKPTFAIIELGYAEVLEAATLGNAGSIPDTAAFRTNYSRIVKALRDADCEVVVTTIPDPMDTAHFSPIAAAARVVKLPPEVVEREYGLRSGDRVMVNGLTEIGYHIMCERAEPLPPGSILSGTVAAEISSRVQSLNAALTSVAAEHGATVYDLCGLFRRVRRQGLAVSSRRLTADFLGGFYSLNGYYPGETGQALIANELLELINRTYETSVEPINVGSTILTDAVAMYQQAGTKAPEVADSGALVPDIPTNTIREFIASVHNNSFGDDFSLNAPELGGHTKGRSHLVGRFQIQFGERFGDAVPIAVQALSPGGLLRTLSQSPFADAFKHRIPDGLMGHNEILRFPKSTYAMDSVTYLDDPLDIALGVVDLKTGKVLGPLLRRGLITTNWLLAMVRIETRTPKSTFAFRGPAALEKDVNGQMMFRYHGKLNIPFPEGFRFPAPDLTNHILIGPDSALDPFLRWQAMHVPESPAVATSGGADRVVASTGDEFSYSYSIPAGAGTASFEYVNHTQDATFRMRGLTWAGFINSRTARSSPGDYDTLTFAGIGTWSKDPGDGSHIATVQVSTSGQFPYVTIMIGGGGTSSANTKPKNVDDTMP